MALWLFVYSLVEHLDDAYHSNSFIALRYTACGHINALWNVNCFISTVISKAIAMCSFFGFIAGYFSEKKFALPVCAVYLGLASCDQNVTFTLFVRIFDNTSVPVSFSWNYFEVLEFSIKHQSIQPSH